MRVGDQAASLIQTEIVYMRIQRKTLAGIVAVLALSAALPALAYPGSALAHRAHFQIDRARAIALAARPGDIVAEELEREHGGSGLRYSFDIRSHGVVYEVGVDANSGAVLENTREGSHPD